MRLVEEKIYKIDARSTSQGYLLIDAMEKRDKRLVEKRLRQQQPKTATKRLMESIQQGWIQVECDVSSRPHSMASFLWFGNPQNPTITTRAVSGPTFDSCRAELDGINQFVDLLHTLN